jgi:hypothetical protein
MRAVIIGLYLIMTSVGLTHGQIGEVRNDEIYWVRYMVTLRLPKTWELVADGDMRGTMANGYPTQSMLPRVEVRKGLKHSYTIGAGMAVLLTYRSPTDEFDVKVVAPELRPYINLMKRDRLDRLTVNQRIRVEQRLFPKSGTTALSPIDYSGPWTTITRFRYLFSVSIPLWRKDDIDRLLLNVGDEVMLRAGDDVGGQVFDQNRVITGLSFNFNPKWGIDLSHIWWFQLSGTDVFLNRNVLQLAVRHTVDISKRKE